MKQYNGFYSCWNCLIEGEKEGNKPTIFPYQLDDKFARRTDEYVYYCTGKTNEGLKGFGGHLTFSSIFFFPAFDTSSIIATEVFHNISLGIVKYIWDRLDRFCVDVKNLTKLSEFVKLTKELKVQKSNLQNKGFYRGCEWWNLLLYYSIPLLIESGASLLFLKHWFLLVNFTAQLNRKKSSLSIRQIMKLNYQITVFVSFCETVLGDKCFFTSKMHSLLHTCLFVLRFGMFWCFSAKCFESALFPIKQMCRDSKVNPMVSLTNGLLNKSSSNLFSHLNEEQYDSFGFSSQKIKFFKKIKKRRTKRKKRWKNSY